MAYSVLIVEDQEMAKTLFEIYVNESNDFELVTSVTNSSLAISICRTVKVDLVLMDVLTELGHSGLDAAAEIKKEFPDTKVIIVTSMPEYTWLSRARSVGVESFWYKNSKRETILNVMRKTMAGEHIYPDETPLVHIGNTTNRDFTEREMDVLKELTSGDSNMEIAERLGISARTVKFHVQNMLDKTGFKTRTELASEARSLGLVIRKQSE